MEEGEEGDTEQGGAEVGPGGVGMIWRIKWTDCASPRECGERDVDAEVVPGGVGMF